MMRLVWVAALLCCSSAQLQFPGQPSPVTPGLNEYVYKMARWHIQGHLHLSQYCQCCPSRAIVWARAGVRGHC